MDKLRSTIYTLVFLIPTIALAVLDICEVSGVYQHSCLYLGCFYATLLLVYIVDKLRAGRKPFILVSAVLLTASILLLSLYFSGQGMGRLWPIILLWLAFLCLGSYIFYGRSAFVLRSAIYITLLVIYLLIGTMANWWVAIGLIVATAVVWLVTEYVSPKRHSYTIESISIMDIVKELEEEKKENA